MGSDYSFSGRTPFSLQARRRSRVMRRTRWPYATARRRGYASLVQGFEVNLLFSREAVAQAAAGVLAVVLGVFGDTLFGRGGAQSHSAQALRTAEGIFLEAERFFHRHPLPPKDAAVRGSVPTLHFHFDELRRWNLCHGDLRYGDVGRL